MHGQIIGVVQDQQPSAVLLQPAFHRVDDAPLVLVLFVRQLKGLRQPGELGDQQLRGIGLHPQHRFVLAGIAIGILDGDLRLANAAQSTDGPALAQRHRFVGGQAAMQAHEQLLPAREVGVAQERHVPAARSPALRRFAKECGQLLQRIQLRLGPVMLPAIDAGNRAADAFGQLFLGPMTQFALLPQAFAQAHGLCIGHDSLSSHAFPGSLLSQQEK